jgi:hypothetical protein
VTALSADDGAGVALALMSSIPTYRFFRSRQLVRFCPDL